MLLVETDHDLRLDRAITKPRNDRLLNVRQCPSCGRDLARIGDCDVAPLIDGLGWQIDEVTWTGAGCCCRREQAAGCCLEDRNIQAVTDAATCSGFGRLSGNAP